MGDDSGRDFADTDGTESADSPATSPDAAGSPESADEDGDNEPDPHSETGDEADTAGADPSAGTAEIDGAGPERGDEAAIETAWSAPDIPADPELLPADVPTTAEEGDDGPETDQAASAGTAHPTATDGTGATADEANRRPRRTRGGLEGPDYDEEMPLADHIEEMLKRLAIVVVVAGSATIVTFPLASEIIDFLWYSILPGTEVARPRVYGPLEFLMTQLKVASLAGLIVALPILVYESYQFMKPGLYPRERRYYLAAIPTSLVLAVIGVLFAYFVVLPAIFTYFLAYSEGAGEIAFALARTFDLILILMAYLAIVFQIPLAIMLAIMMGLTTRRWLQEKRLYFWGAFLGIAFISSPDPTGMAPIIIALTMVALYEGTLMLLKWVGR